MIMGAPGWRSSASLRGEWEMLEEARDTDRDTVQTVDKES